MKSRVSAAVAAALFVVAAPAAFADVELEGEAVETTGIEWIPQAQQLVTTDAKSGLLRFYDADGQLVNESELAEPVRSVQSLSSYKGELYIGDVGDPTGARNSVAVHKVDPDNPEAPATTYRFAYADGPQDAHAVLVSGKGRIYVIAENGIYRSELDLDDAGINKLTRAADSPEGVLDADFLSDGSTMVVRDANGVQLLDAFTWESNAELEIINGNPSDSLTVIDDTEFWLGAENRVASLEMPTGFRASIPCPTCAGANEPAPVPSASPQEPVESQAPSPEPSPEGEQSPGNEEQAETMGEEEQVPKRKAPASRGTWTALIGSAAVAVLCGLVAFFVRMD